MQEKQLHIDIIGYDCGWGSGDFRCEDGPAHIAADNLLHALRQLEAQATWKGPLGLKNLGNHAAADTKEKTLPFILESLGRLYQSVSAAIENNRVPLVIGGDHSSAIGTWSGVAAATKSLGRFGLIWIDAHLDCHTYETSWQGKFGGWWHGQPVAALTGHGLQSLTSIGGIQPKISPAHIAMIGVHSFEPAEEAFIKKHNIRVYSLRDVEQRGFAAVFAEALDRVTQGTDGFGMTIDLDAFRPEDAPGVGAAENTGLCATSVLPIIEGVGRHPSFRALEIAEFNPHKDIDRKTARLVEKLAAAVFTKD